MSDVCGVKSEIFSNFQLAVPLIISYSAQIIITLINTIMMGYLGVEYLAAGGLAVIIYITCFLSCIGLNQGVTVYIAQAYPNSNFEEIGKLVSNGIYLSIISSLLFMFVLWNIMGWLSHLFANQNTVYYANEYLHAVLWGFLPALIFSIFKDFFAAISKPYITSNISLIMIPITFILNYGIIYGRWGLPKLGLIGIGWSTTFVSYLMLTTVICYILFVKSFQKFHFLQHLLQININIVCKLVTLGFPVAVMFGLQIGILAVSSFVMGYLGTKELAAAQILNQCLEIAFIIPLGISLATNVRVGYSYGEKNITKITTASHAGLTLTILCVITIGLLFCIFGKDLTQVFLGFGNNKDALTLNLAVNLLLIGAFYQFFRAVQVVLNATLRGLEDTLIPMFIGVLCYWGIGIGFGMITVFYIKLNVIYFWVCLSIGSLCAVIILIYRLNYIKRKLGASFRT